MELKKGSSKLRESPPPVDRAILKKTGRKFVPQAQNSEEFH